MVAEVEPLEVTVNSGLGPFVLGRAEARARQLRPLDSRNRPIRVVEGDRVLRGDRFGPRPAGAVSVFPQRAERLVDEEHHRCIAYRAWNRGRARRLLLRTGHDDRVHGSVGTVMKACRGAAFLRHQRSDVDKPALRIEGDRGDHADAHVSDPGSTVVLGTRVVQPEHTVSGTLAHPEPALRPERETTGPRQFARSLSITAEAEPEVALGTEDPHLARLQVGDEQPPARVLDDRLDPREEIGVFAFDLPELQVDRAMEGRDITR